MNNSRISDEDRVLLENYRNYLAAEAEKAKVDNKKQIQAFKRFAKSKGVAINDENFDYVPTIGIVASKQNLLLDLKGDIQPDKEGLIPFDGLKSKFQIKPNISGYFFDEKFMAMPHSYFRRGYSKENNFSPSLIDVFWREKNLNFKTFIAMDIDRVRIDVDDSTCMEFDAWFGAPFSKDVAAIPDGTSKYRPPLDIADSHIAFFFGDAYSLDIIWTSKEGIKSFQAEEFKSARVKIAIDGCNFYPVRYIHAEYDIHNACFRHFDGAVHLYTEDEYFARRNSDFNHNKKEQKHIKSKSIKLFKMNGNIDVNSWVEYCCHFCSGNPLIIEYFTGSYPQQTVETIAKLRSIKQR